MKRKAKEAGANKPRQCEGMNYNNFSCRIVIPRLTVSAPTELPAKVPVKRARKTTVRRRIGAVVGAVMMLAMSLSASAADEMPLPYVPATATVAFTGFSGRLSLEKTPSEIEDERDLAAQIEALSDQVRTLTAARMPVVAVRVEEAMRLSTITGVVLCAGVAVAIVRAGLLFRGEVSC